MIYKSVGKQYCFCYALFLGCRAMVYRYYNRRIEAEVEIKSRVNATRLVLKYVDGILKISVPIGYEHRYYPELPPDIVNKVLEIKEKLSKDNSVGSPAFGLGRIPVSVRLYLDVRADSSIASGTVEHSYDADTGTLIIVLHSEDELQQHSIQALVRRVLRKRLCQLLQIQYMDEINALLEKYNFPKAKLKYGTATRAWATCSSRGEITLSGSLYLLPDHLVEFVFAHEITHLAEMNHSPGFYRKLAAVFPNHRELQKEVDSYAMQYLWMLRK